jgi:hypothetical protein
MWFKELAANFPFNYAVHFLNGFIIAHLFVLLLSFDMMLFIVLQADAALIMEQRHFVRASLEYVFLLQEVQERKKFEFVETVSVCLLHKCILHSEYIVAFKFYFNQTRYDGFGTFSISWQYNVIHDTLYSFTTILNTQNIIRYSMMAQIP